MTRPAARTRRIRLTGAVTVLSAADPVLVFEEVVEKILRHSEALGGITRITFKVNAAFLPRAKLMKAIEVIGTRAAPAVRQRFDDR